MNEKITQSGSRGEDAEAQSLAEFVRTWHRALGEEAAKQGVATEVLLGLLDGGATLDEFMEALVMHGELPALLERPETSAEELRLVDSPDQGWHLAS